MKKIFTFSIAILLLFVGIAQQFIKVTSSVITNLQETTGGTSGCYDKDGERDLYVNVMTSSLYYLTDANNNVLQTLSSGGGEFIDSCSPSAICVSACTSATVWCNIPQKTISFPNACALDPGTYYLAIESSVFVLNPNDCSFLLSTQTQAKDYLNNLLNCYFSVPNVPVTDSCTLYKVVQITVPAHVSVTATANPSTGCSNGSVTANPSNGCPPLTYSWNTSPVQTTQIASNLSAGNYQVTVTDAVGCTATENATVGGDTAITISITKTNASCSAVCNGSAIASATGGQTPYTYLWDAGQTISAISNLCTGTYTITITDAVGCTKKATVIIGQSQMTITTTASNASCSDICNGSATANASGGGGTPYTFLWSNGQTTSTSSGLCVFPPAYTVIATDGVGCTITATVSIGAGNTPPTAAFTVTNELCMNQPFTLTNNSSLGTSFQWDFGDGTILTTTLTVSQNHTYTIPGQYVTILQATNACGCSVSSKIVQVTPSLTSPSYNPTCCTSVDGNYNYISSFTITSQADVVSFFSTFTFRSIKGNLIINSNSVTPIQIAGKTIEFGPWAKLIIMPGSILQLENSILTGLSVCGTMWQGIEVWGNPAKTHLPSQQAFQGKLTMGGSTIERAHNAVTVGKYPDRFLPTQCDEITPNTICLRGQYDVCFSGGILDVQPPGPICIACEFKNNAHNIRFAPYSFPNASTVRSYRFLGGVLLDPGYKIGAVYQYSDFANPNYAMANPKGRTSRFAYLLNVRWQGASSITFSGNTFLPSSGSPDDGAEIGIEIIGAKCIITGNQFINMNRGISGLYISSSPFLGNKITGNTFNNIVAQTPSTVTPAPVAGIYLGGSKSDWIQGNSFGDPTLFPLSQVKNPYGMYMDNSSGFSVWDNRFNRNRIGIFVRNSFKGGGIIRNLVQQSQAAGGNFFVQCSTSVETNVRNPKLEIRCNQTNNNSLIPSDYGINWFNSGGQLANQGLTAPNSNPIYITRPAGNRFNFSSPLPTSNPSSLRQIKSAYPIPYTYRSHNNPQPYIPLGQNVSISQQPVPCNNFGCCPIDPCLIPANPPPCRIAQVINIDQQISALQTEFNTALANLDKVQTAQLIAAINHNNPVPPGQLKNLLLSASPLSDEVLLAFINRTAAQIPPGIFKDVVVPNSPVSDSVLPSLQLKLNSLPSGIAGQIQDVQANSTVRTLSAISRDINAYEAERQYQINQLLSFYVENDSAQAIHLLEQENTADANQQLLGAYIAAGNSSAAQAQLAAMTAAVPEEQAFLDLQGMLLNLQLQGRSIFDLDSAEEQLVRNIASMPSSLARTNACNLLYLLFNEHCPDSLNGISLRQQENSLTSSPSGRIKEGFLGDNIPNPFNNTTTIPYVLPENTEKAYINIYDVAGKKISSYEVFNKNNSLVISSIDFSEGVYIYKLEANGETFGNKKMIVIKE